LFSWCGVPVAMLWANVIPAAGLTFAHTIATGEPHKLNKPFALERFETGALIDEHGAAAVAH